MGTAEQGHFRGQPLPSGWGASRNEGRGSGAGIWGEVTWGPREATGLRVQNWNVPQPARKLLDSQEADRNEHSEVTCLYDIYMRTQAHFFFPE